MRRRVRADDRVHLVKVAWKRDCARVHFADDAKNLCSEPVRRTLLGVTWKLTMVEVCWRSPCLFGCWTICSGPLWRFPKLKKACSPSFPEVHRRTHEGCQAESVERLVGGDRQDSNGQVRFEVSAESRACIRLDASVSLPSWGGKRVGGGVEWGVVDGVDMVSCS